MKDYKVVAYRESDVAPGSVRILYLYNPNQPIKVRLMEINEEIARLKSIFPGAVKVDCCRDVYNMIRKKEIEF